MTRAESNDKGAHCLHRGQRASRLPVCCCCRIVNSFRTASPIPRATWDETTATRSPGSYGESSTSPSIRGAGATLAGVIEDEVVDEPSRGFVGGYRMELVTLDLPTLPLVGLPYGWGRDFASIIEGYRTMAGMIINGEDMPRAENRITLNPTSRTRTDCPWPTSTWTNTQTTKRCDGTRRRRCLACTTRLEPSASSADQVTGLREKIPSDHPPKPTVFKSVQL